MNSYHQSSFEWWNIPCAIEFNLTLIELKQKKILLVFISIVIAKLLNTCFDWEIFKIDIEVVYTLLMSTFETVLNYLNSNNTTHLVFTLLRKVKVSTFWKDKTNLKWCSWTFIKWTNVILKCFHSLFLQFHFIISLESKYEFSSIC